MKALGIIFLVVIAFVAVAIKGNSDGFTAEDAADSPAQPAPATKPVKLIASKSFCLVNSAAAKIHFYMTLRNTDTSAQDVDVTPWRRYSDNSVNDSMMDQLTMTVPAGETKKFRAEFGFNAEDHSVLECGLKLEDELEPTKIAAL